MPKEERTHICIGFFFLAKKLSWIGGGGGGGESFKHFPPFASLRESGPGHPRSGGGGSYLSLSLTNAGQERKTKKKKDFVPRNLCQKESWGRGGKPSSLRVASQKGWSRRHDCDGDIFIAGTTQWIIMAVAVEAAALMALSRAICSFSSFFFFRASVCMTSFSHTLSLTRVGREGEGGKKRKVKNR